MEHPRVPKRKKRERDLCLEVVIWPCFYGLYQFLKVNIVRISIYLSWKKPESKTFAEKNRVVLLKVQDAKKKYNGKLRGYF